MRGVQRAVQGRVRCGRGVTAGVAVEARRCSAAAEAGLSRLLLVEGRVLRALDVLRASERLSPWRETLIEGVWRKHQVERPWSLVLPFSSSGRLCSCRSPRSSHATSSFPGRTRPCVDSRSISTPADRAKRVQRAVVNLLPRPSDSMGSVHRRAAAGVAEADGAGADGLSESPRSDRGIRPAAPVVLVARGRVDVVLCDGGRASARAVQALGGMDSAARPLN